MGCSKVTISDNNMRTILRGKSVPVTNEAGTALGHLRSYPYYSRAESKITVAYKVVLHGMEIDSVSRASMM